MNRKKNLLLKYSLLILAIFNQICIDSNKCYGQFSDFNIANNEHVATIDGIHDNGRLGYDVSAIGDINNDGIDDIGLCATYATPESISETGEIYIIFGQQNIQIDQFDLHSLDGSNGFKVRGINKEHRLGYGGAFKAGDVNNDGIDDIVLSTPYTDYEALPMDGQGLNNGSAYIIFGKEDSFSEFFDLTLLDGSNGFRVVGWQYWENAGTLAGGAGDLNGDGIDDLYVTADDAEDPNNISTGQVYIIYGKNGSFPADIVVNQISQNVGFTITGAAADDNLGVAAAPLDDINDDGINDLILGGWYANGNRGGAYVIYGTCGNTYTTLSVSNLNGSNGFALIGNSSGNNFGSVVGDAGDLNHDGIHDLFVGARKESNTGKMYIVYGNATGFPSQINANTISNNYGITITGGNSGDFAGWDGSALGDFNGDNIDDFVVSSVFAETSSNLNSSGLVHVIYGIENGLPSQVNLNDLTAEQGFEIEGADSKARLGFSVSGNFDFDNNGKNDLLIGADYGSSNTFTRGRAYILYNPGCNNIDVQLNAWLEGAYIPNLGEMNTALSSERRLLPGQSPTNSYVNPTPPGQPFSITPWNYQGTEGAHWTDSNYTGDEVDWVLVSFRTGIQKHTQIGMSAGLIKSDGSISFPEGTGLNSSISGPLYIVVEHRNHIGIMTAEPINIINGTLTHDFRTANSYHDPTGFGQKLNSIGEWMMYAGDVNQSDFPSYDINGTDKTEWFNDNGKFDFYISSDINLDGDITGQDKSIWFHNNGISSRVPR